MWGRSAQLWGHRRQDALTCPPWPGPLCSSPWALLPRLLDAGTGEGPLEDSGALLPALESGPESPSLSLPLPGSWAQAVLTQPPWSPNFGSEGDHLLPWKQQHNRGLSCELVPTAPRIGPQTPDLWKWLKILRGPGSVLCLQVWQLGLSDHCSSC